MGLDLVRGKGRKGARGKREVRGIQEIFRLVSYLGRNPNTKQISSSSSIRAPACSVPQNTMFLVSKRLFTANTSCPQLSKPTASKSHVGDLGRHQLLIGDGVFSRFFDHGTLARRPVIFLTVRTQHRARGRALTRARLPCLGTEEFGGSFFRQNRCPRHL